MNPNRSESRIAVLARMATAPKTQPLGRTAVMKLMYFLQELEGISLGYDFRLFTYGPFDSEVLSDLTSACSLGIVAEKAVIYVRGYGYSITSGIAAEVQSSALKDNEPLVAQSVDRMIAEFGSMSAAELELRSTILFVDREFAQSKTPLSRQLHTDRVQGIKPHFERAIIVDRIGEMADKGYFRASTSNP